MICISKLAMFEAQKNISKSKASFHSNIDFIIFHDIFSFLLFQVCNHVLGDARTLFKTSNGHLHLMGSHFKDAKGDPGKKRKKSIWPDTTSSLMVLVFRKVNKV
jgi:hypothetical protein